MEIKVKDPEQRKKKAQMSIDSIGDIAIGMGVAIIAVAVVAMILGTMLTNVDDPNATSIINKGLIAIGSFADWFIILIVVVIAVVVLALLQYLRGRGGVGGGKA